MIIWEQISSSELPLTGMEQISLMQYPFLVLDGGWYGLNKREMSHYILQTIKIFPEVLQYFENIQEHYFILAAWVHGGHECILLGNSSQNFISLNLGTRSILGGSDGIADKIQCQKSVSNLSCVVRESATELVSNT